MTIARVGVVVVLVIGITMALQVESGANANTFDHGYRALGDVLRKHVRQSRVDYAALKADRALLDCSLRRTQPGSSR